jgi:branched-chain amino acid transport system substrate-binding protein
MTPFLSKITGSYDGLFGIFFGPQGISLVNQSFDLGISKKARIAGDGAIVVATSLPAMGAKADGFVGIDRYVPVLDGVFNTPFHKRFLDDANARLKQIDPSGPLPDRYVQSNYEGLNTLKVGMQKSGFRGREDSMKLIEALEGLEMKESDDFPQGDKTLRKEDHQAFVREFIFEIRSSQFKILEVVPKEKTVFPPACKFA